MSATCISMSVTGFFFLIDDDEAPPLALSLRLQCTQHIDKKTVNNPSPNPMPVIADANSSTEIAYLTQYTMYVPHNVNTTETWNPPTNKNG